MIPAASLDACHEYLATSFPQDAPGAVAAIVAGGDATFVRSYGLANLDPKCPMSTSTSLRICSFTKQFLCATLLQLAHERVIDLDRHPGVYVGRFEGLNRRVSLRMLAQHRSGVNDHWMLAMLSGSTAQRRFTIAEGDEIIERTLRSVFAPGSQFLYSNSNYAILERVLEEVTGESFSTSLQLRVLDPLGMRQTSVQVDTSLALPGGTCGYGRASDGEWVAETNRLHWSATAGMVSTLEDLLLWEQCLRAPAASPLSHVAQLFDAMPFADGRPGSYAFGMRVQHDGERTMHWHGGALRGWRGFQLRLLRENVSFYILMNRTESARRHAHELARLCGLTIPGVPAAVAVDEARIRALCGFATCDELGLLAELSHDGANAMLDVSGERSVLYSAEEGAALISEDGHFRLRILERGKFALESPYHGFQGIFSPCQMQTEPLVQFASHRYWSQELATSLEIISDHDCRSLALEGPFGIERYRLVDVDDRTGYFECARALDEPAPGRFTVRLDPTGRSLTIGSLSCRDLRFSVSDS